ncbi:hypothetical protein [Luteococcus peritonei]|uniref:Uncharacterized protein n=1 Tax=Luteococcus peritonei TaxID=88874 RepID=A0ABW4RVH1_9ACTN
MEAVYTLLDVERGVPEVWASTYDVRALLEATVRMRDGKKFWLPGPLRRRLAGTVVGELLERHQVV